MTAVDSIVAGDDTTAAVMKVSDIELVKASRAAATGPPSPTATGGDRLPRLGGRSGQHRQADAMGVSGPRVSDVERGNLDVVAVSVLRAYVEALGGRLKVTAEFEDSTYLVA